MKKNIKKIFLISLISLFVFPLSTLALGQMTQPINITNALRGEKIHQEIIAVNGESRSVLVIFTGGGQIKDWVKFYNSKDLENVVATTTIEANTNLNMIAVFSIPEEVANGEYIGTVSVSSIPSETEQVGQSSTSLTQKIDRQVKIIVSDTENISLEASVIPKSYDLNLKESLNVRIIYDNQSNVNLSPSINFKIKNSEKTFYNVIYPYPENELAVNSQAIHEIPALEISTMNLEKGKYQAELQFMRGDKVILTKQFNFSLGMQNSLFIMKIVDFIKNNLIWSIGLACLMLLAITGLLVRRNIIIRQDLKKDFKRT